MLQGNALDGLSWKWQDKGEGILLPWYSLPSFTSHVPDFEYLFILGVLWDFTAEKCESQKSRSAGVEANFSAAIALSCRFSEGLHDIWLDLPSLLRTFLLPCLAIGAFCDDYFNTLMNIHQQQKY
jgi:hypothetical protein